MVILAQKWSAVEQGVQLSGQHLEQSSWTYVGFELHTQNGVVYMLQNFLEF